MGLCESNALCVGIAPAVFEMDDDDVLHVLDETPADGLREKVLEAIRNCPKQAISLEEAHSGEASGELPADLD